MANTCFNFIQLFGSEKSIEIIKNQLSTDIYDDHMSVVGLGYIPDGATTIDISAETDWLPLREFLQSLSSDYNLLIECQYDEIGEDIAGKFAYLNGKLMMDLSFTYLEGKYQFMDWEEFIDYEVISLLEDERPFNEFIALFNFVSDEHLIELEELFFEHANEN